MKPSRLRQHGLTMLELAIILVVLAIVSALAVPSFGGRIDRARAQAAAEALAADLTEARFEAARRGLPLYVQATSGRDWCWAVSTLADCPCGSAQSCQLRSASARQHRGVELMSSLSLRLDPSGQPSAAQSLELRTKRNDRLRVELSPMGRARLCAVAGHWPRLPGC